LHLAGFWPAGPVHDERGLVASGADHIRAARHYACGEQRSGRIVAAIISLLAMLQAAAQGSLRAVIVAAATETSGASVQYGGNTDVRSFGHA
jgi:hypothetical protein